MKSLLDIQQDIRNLERSVSSITDSIKCIHADIDELRNVNQNMEIDYAKIETLAKQISFGKHPLGKINDKYVCRIYLKMLLNIVRFDSEKSKVLNRMVFIEWIKLESGVEQSLDDLYKDCFRMRTNSYCEMIPMIPVKCRESFVVDALIVANLGGNANREIYMYIAGLIAILGIEKERARALSFVAKTALCQSTGQMKVKDMDTLQKYAKSFKHYIGEEIFEKGIKSLRQIIVEIPDSEVSDFKWKVKQGQEVKENELIATYRRFTIKNFRPVEVKRVSNLNCVTEEIKAPSAGTVFQFRDRCINYGVLAHASDDKDSIKAWVKARE